jgi:hypothetical protein
MAEKGARTLTVRQYRKGASLKGWAGLLVVALVASLEAGCSQTNKPQPNLIQRIQGEQPTIALPQGFFGKKDEALLRPGKEGQAGLVYIKPNVKWSKYHKILLDPVQFWDSRNSSVSPTDQQTLTAYYYDKLKEELAKNFILTDHGGPDVMVVEVALVRATGAVPVLRSVSLVVPQIRLVNALQSLATGSYVFVGSAETAGKVLDAQTGELLAAAVDVRTGGTSMKAAAQWQWGDVEAAIDLWAQKTSERLKNLVTTGSTLPPNQANG